SSILLLEALQACVGTAAGIELHAFIQNLDQMPDIQLILNGEKVPIPKEIDLQYAVASALVGHAIRAKKETSKNKIYGHILNFALKFPQREMGVMLVSDMHRAIGQELFEVNEFAQWADSVARIMIYE
ncbi:MAG TPA: ATPase, partial [Methylotenera sp.]|nr:ATPase [Methylotenera sp.]